jgi:hypothetical protein
MVVFKRQSVERAPTLPRNTIPFPTLPLELREQIYTHTILPLSSPTKPNRLTVSTADAIHGSDSRYPYFLAPLCHINEATRIDFGLWFIRNTEFGLLYPQHIVYFAQFLATFPNDEGFAAIRRLDLQLFGRYKPVDGNGSAYIDFMMRCTGLTSVRMKFEMWYLLKPDRAPDKLPTLVEFEEYADRVLNFDTLVEVHGLVRLFELRSLNRLIIEVWPKVIAKTKQGLRPLVPDCWPLMERVAEWLRKGFKERGMRVEVRLVEIGNSGIRWDGMEKRR